MIESVLMNAILNIQSALKEMPESVIEAIREFSISLSQLPEKQPVGLLDLMDNLNAKLQAVGNASPLRLTLGLSEFLRNISDNNIHRFSEIAALNIGDALAIYQSFVDLLVQLSNQMPIVNRHGEFSSYYLLASQEVKTSSGIVFETIIASSDKTPGKLELVLIPVRNDPL